MAGMSYPPFSAPSTMERDRKRKEKPKRWTNMKRAFKKPWQKRSPPQERSRTTKDRSALPPPAGLEDRYGEFSPFGHGRQKINPLSGGGNPFLFHQLTGGAAFPNYHPITRAPYSEEASPYEKRRKTEATSEYFDPPTPKPSRPALSNIFPIHETVTKTSSVPVQPGRKQLIHEHDRRSSSPMHNSSKVQKSPAAAAAQQKKEMAAKTSSVPFQPGPKSLIYERRSSTPAVRGVPQNALKNKYLHVHTSAQSTVSDITDERMGRRERTRRPSAIKMLPVLPPPERSPPVVREETRDRRQDSNYEDKDEAPSHVMYHTPANLAHGSDNGVLDSTGMYGWSEQPNEQLQKLEEELEGEGPEGAEEGMGIGSWEKEREEVVSSKNSKKGPAKSKIKKKNSSKLAPKGEEVTDFAQEFVRQLTIGGNETDVLY
jgi:hypothetical protein